ncbi:biotin/lipoyl-containing protein [Ramlibacter sp.]|uniref:acetyl-CoA carboxylase biotin carboxyl carrier protein subunit n=1 Tax=Ramlibacter sp. TaxID=1917967 RepID=UPI003D0D70E6
MHRNVSINGGTAAKVNVTRGASLSRVWRDAKAHAASLTPSGDGATVEVDGLSARITLVTRREEVLIHAFGRTWRLEVVDPVERALGAGEQSDVARAPMPGSAIAVMVKPGDSVADGQPLVIIESMKMQTEICATRAGIVDQVNVRVGETFAQKAPLVTLVPLATEE